MRNRNRALVSGYVALVLLGLSLSVSAATVTWDGAGADNNLSTPTNWLGGIAPAPHDALVFDGFARLSPVNDYSAATAFDGIAFAPSAGAFTLNGNQVTLHGDIADNTPVLTQTINLALALDGIRNIGVTDNAFLTIAGPISGAGFGPTKTGNGTLLLTGTNTFTGPLTINAGVVSVASDSNLGGPLATATPGAIVINGGTLRNTASFTLGANRGFALGPASGSGSGTFDVASGTTLTYGGIIANNGAAGTGGLTKISFGGLTLSGANTYTGPTLVRNGSLTLNFADANAPVSNIISPSSMLVLGGATAGLGQDSNASLIMTGKGGANNTQTFASTNIDIYGSVINVTKGSGGTATLNLGALTHTVGGTVVIPTAPAGTAGTVTTTTSVATTNGILGGWAVAGTPNVQRNITLGTDWATVDASGNIVAYTNYTTAPAYDGTAATLFHNNAAIAASVDKNLKYLGTATATELRVDAENAGTTTDINTLAYTTGGINNTLTIGTGNTLRLGVYGGIFKEATGNNQLYIGGVGGTQSGNGTTGSSGVGNLTAGGPNPNTPGEIVLTLADTANNNGGLNIEANIVDNGTGAVTLIKTGVMSTKIDGHNSFSGGLFINQGRFQLAGSEVGSPNPDGLGTGRVTVAPGGYLFVSGVNGTQLFAGRGAIAGAIANTAQNAPITNDMTISGLGDNQEPIGAIRLGGRAILSGQLTLGGDARIAGGNGAAYSTINPDGTTLYVDPGNALTGKITGPFNLDIGAAVSIATNFVLSNPANDWSGNTTLIGRTGGTASTTRLRLGANNVIPDGVGKGNLVFGNSGNTISPIILDMNGFSETVNGLSSAPSANLPQNFIENNGFTATITGAAGAKSYVFATPTSTLTVGGFDQSANFGGIIRDNDPSLTFTLPDPNGGAGTVVLSPQTASKVAITKIGAGVQTLSGANTYTGDTNVNAGTLSVTGSLATTGNVNVNTSATSAGTLSGTSTASGGAGSVGNVTLAAATGTNVARLAPGTTGAVGSVGTLTLNSLIVNGGDLQFDLVDPAAANPNDKITVTGVANFAAPSTITPGPTGKSGTYTLLTAGTLTLGVAPTLNAPQFTRNVYTLDTNGTPNTIKLTLINNSKSLTWSGAVNSVWDLVQTQNWLDASNNPEKFFNGDSVTFNNTATNRNVSLNLDVFPSSVTVDNNIDHAYTISGSGSISGTATLTKTGTGTLSVATNNGYSGGTTINGGMVQVGNGGTSGSLGTGDVANAGILALNRTDSYSIGNVISGAGEVRSIGAGRATLSGVNTYTGPTNILAGTVVATNSASVGDPAGAAVTVSPGAAFDIAGNTTANNLNFGAKQFVISGTGVGGTGALVNSGTTNQQNAFQSVTLAADASVGGTARMDIRAAGTSSLDLATHTLTKIGTNQVNLVNANVTDGNIVVNGGQLGIEGTTSIPNNNTGTTITYNAGTILETFNLSGTVTRPMVFNGSGIQIGNGGNNTSTVGSNMTLNGDVTVAALNGTNNTSTLNLNGVIGEINGPHSITKTGPSVLNLNGANTFTGPVTISGGTLNAAILVNGGAPSGIGQSSSAPANLILSGGNLGYTGNIAVSTDRTFTLIGPGGGLDASGVSGAPVTFSSTAPLVVSGNAPVTLTLTGANTDANTLTAQIVDGAGASATLSLTKSGAGTWILSNAANTYTGVTTINGGLLNVTSLANGGSPSGIGQSSAAAANLVLQNGGALGFIGTAPASTDRLISMPSVVVGVTPTSAGELNASGAPGAPVNFTNTGPIAIGNNANVATLTLSGTNTDANTLAAQITDGPATNQTSLVKNGPGTWVLSNPSSTFTGSTTVNAGTLSLTGSFPSSAVTVNGGTFDSAGAQTNVLSLSINGGGASVSAGALKVGNGTATTPLQTGGGKLDLKANGVIVDHPDFDAPSELLSVRQQIINAYNPSAPGAGDGNWQGTNGIGSSLLTNPANANKAIGYATSAELLGASGGTFMGQTVDGSAVLARFTLAGDANLSGKVDFTDLVALAQNYGADFNANPTTDSWWIHGDFNYDGKVNFTDLVKLAQNYGSALPTEPIPGASVQFDADLAKAFAVVPEPGTISLAAGCGLLALRRRHHHRRR